VGPMHSVNFAGVTIIAMSTVIAVRIFASSVGRFLCSVSPRPLLQPHGAQPK